MSITSLAPASFVTYEEVEQAELTFPQSSFEQFKATADRSLASFTEDNQLVQLVDEGSFTIGHLHNLLNTLFHQVYMSSSSFALAGTMIDSRYFRLREYLFHHAEEEQDHWKWIVQDLRNTGYTGPDPRVVFPQFPTQSYLSFAMFLAQKQPAARLAMAYILEGVSGNLAVHYGSKVAAQLGLTKAQMSFFITHGELDAGHSQDILEVLQDAPLTPYEWAYCEYAAECTAHLYKAMYNHAAAMTG